MKLRSTIALGLVLCAVGLSGCVRISHTTQATEPVKRVYLASELPSQTVQLPLNLARAQVLSLMNMQRMANGRPPMVMDSTLTRVAQNYANDMERRNFFSHTNPDGLDFGRRIRKAGVYQRKVSENLGRGQRTPERIVEAWMESVGHRMNLLARNNRIVGIGRSNDNRWVAVFSGG
jgi:uncharacterized protein YkwD